MNQPKDSLEKVEQFMRAAQQLIMEGKPEFTQDMRKEVRLRIRVMFEELKEFCIACGLTGAEYLAATAKAFLADYQRTDAFGLSETTFEDWDPVEALDALVDMRYVNDGTILTMGFGKVFDAAFDAVHENNMTKFIPIEDTKEIRETTDKYNKSNIEVAFVGTEIDGKRYFAVKDNGGKLKKPAGYRSVNLDSFIH